MSAFFFTVSAVIMRFLHYAIWITRGNVVLITRVCFGYNGFEEVKRGHKELYR
jgi:hypothetical protein